MAMLLLYGMGDGLVLQLTEATSNHVEHRLAEVDQLQIDLQRAETTSRFTRQVHQLRHDLEVVLGSAPDTQVWDLTPTPDTTDELFSSGRRHDNKR